jgi:hypothetical protein
VASGLERFGAVAGLYTDPGGGGSKFLDFADADLLDVIETGDVLVLVAYGTVLGTPAGAGWAARATFGNWKLWTKLATALEALPTLTAVDGALDAAGALLVYRGATEGYLIGDTDQVSTNNVNDQGTPTLTVIDSNGLLVAAWLGSSGGPEPDVLPAPVSSVLVQETSGASGNPARWFVVGEAPINGAPTTAALTLHTSDPDDVHVAIAALRHRPPHRPAALSGVAFVNLGLTP